MSIMPWIW
ncbi:Protein of unknown function [Thermobacillus xylanilyticus]|uniref:Uncharacterized protein n=1 Tax=Thermobacillus xylanilyticus TaxID=76633 RepID=A0ABN7RUG9_THEXY|nr:Protein of unknown function [Thermobacillus xylanilyticus]